MIVFCRKAEKMTELEYICPLAHCVNLTRHAGGLFYTETCDFWRVDGMIHG